MFGWRLWGFALAILAGNALASDKRIALDVTLKAFAVVEHDQVRLSDIASLASQEMAHVTALENVPIMRAPRVGYMDCLSRTELTRILQGQPATEGVVIAFHGADSVNIQSADQNVEAGSITDMAIRAVQSQLQNRFVRVSASVATPVQPVRVPFGNLTMRVRPLDKTTLYARLPVWVDILVNGELYRSVVVPVNIKAEREVMVAVRDIAAGSTVSAKDFSTQVEDAAGFRDPVDIANVHDATMRMRRAISRGRILTQQDIYPTGAVLKGDVIKLTYSNATISLETTAIADQDGQAGEMIRVKPEKGIDTVMAKVISSGMVQIWEK